MNAWRKISWMHRNLFFLIGCVFFPALSKNFNFCNNRQNSKISSLPKEILILWSMVLRGFYAVEMWLFSEISGAPTVFTAGCLLSHPTSDHQAWRWGKELPWSSFLLLGNSSVLLSSFLNFFGLHQTNCSLSLLLQCL